MGWARQARQVIANGYHRLAPSGLRRELWHLRHTGRTYRASLPRRFAPYAAARQTLPTAREVQQRVRDWRMALGLDGTVSHGRACIVVVTYDNLDYTRYTLTSVLEKTLYPDYEIVVVDNGSGAALTNFLRDAAREHPNLTVVFNGSNVGFSAANNIGLAHAKARESAYIVLLNNDVIVTPGWLATLIGHAQDPHVGMVGPVTNFIGNQARIRVGYQSLDGIDAFAKRYTTEHTGATFDIPVLAMYCVVMRRAVVDQIGPLDEIFGVGMFEDDDYALRVRQAGYRVVCAEDVFIHHFGRASFSKMEDEAYKRLFEQNKRLFEEKWNRPWLPHRYRPHKRMGLPSRALVGARSAR